MKFSAHWLHDWVPFDLGTAELCDRLTSAGLEVDGVEPVAADLADVVVATVEAVERHPNADKLKVCQVYDGDSRLTVVCGAPNVRVGMKSALARVGAVLPGGVSIKRAALRGVESSGMLCSEVELGLGDDDDGILDLESGYAAAPGVLTPGRGLSEVLSLDDVTIELDLTPNRGDALSIRGLAREVALLTRQAVARPSYARVAATTDATFSVAVENFDGCPRYLGRVISGVDATRPVPWWLRERLRRSGLRSIDPVVDVTNYVLLELGQPMHAFDLGQLRGGIVVRDARPGESLTLLDDREVAVGDETGGQRPLLITDARGPIAIAGVMGGNRSGIGPSTRDVFLECAFFDPLSVAATARRFTLQTDAAHRYERGVDYQLQAEAMERATGLLLDLVGGGAGPVVEAVSQPHLPRANVVRLRKRRLDRLVGERIPATEVGDILARLELNPVTSGSDDEVVWTVTTPSHRFDIEREEDLVEEVLRIHGYNAVGSRVPTGALPLGQPDLAVAPAGRFADLLVDLGYAEAITYSFVDQKLADVLEPSEDPIRVKNPVSSEHAVMRTSLLPGLVGALRRNLARQTERVRLFEVGQCFRVVGDELEQDLKCGGILFGPRHAPNWASESVETDFFDVKGDVERLLALGGRPASFVPTQDPALHPGQAAAVCIDGQPAGRLGRLHPEVAATLDMPRNVYCFELDLQALATRQRRVFGGLSRQPSVRRDLALVVGDTVPASEIESIVRERVGELLSGFAVFDLYTGEGIESGRKSVGISLTFQHRSRTLAEAEINQKVDDALADLNSRLGARLR